ncbi:MAG: hypothetical protein WCG85_26920 [Polyangia bacterium]
MKRRQVVIGLGLVVAGGSIAALMTKPGRQLWSFRWNKIPAVTVISAPGDPRIRAVREAVDFWNRTFAELGSAFRLGAVTPVTGSVPDAALQTLSGQFWRPLSWHTLPPSVDRVAGDLIVVLSDADFISFTAGDGARVMVAIRDQQSPPLTLPNVLRNVVADELGHAIGLGHDADPAPLMCGRPASCRPDAFQSPTDRFFPLSAAEKARLIDLYPSGWAASR